MYKEIIEKNWNNGNEVIMHKSVDMVSDLLKNIKNEHPEMYWLFIRKQQGLFSGGHYDEISGKAHDFSRGMKAPQCFF